MIAVAAYSYLNIYFLWFTFSVTKFETYAENAYYFKGRAFMLFVCGIVTFTQQMLVIVLFINIGTIFTSYFYNISKIQETYAW